MVVVGLTGGIGSGKSTVTRLLAERGATIVDADVVAREVVAPDGPAYGAVVARFGPAVVAAGGSLDRAALAALVFGDGAARDDLNRITHPAIREEMTRRVTAIVAADPGAVVVMDIPLLAESGRDRYALDGVLVVDLPVELAISRLLADRGFTEEDARARLAAQATREQRQAIADLVLDNSGDLDHLRSEVDRAWVWIQSAITPERGERDGDRPGPRDAI